MKSITAALGKTDKLNYPMCNLMLLLHEMSFVVRVPSYALCRRIGVHVLGIRKFVAESLQ